MEKNKIIKILKENPNVSYQEFKAQAEDIKIPSNLFEEAWEETHKTPENAGYQAKDMQKKDRKYSPPVTKGIIIGLGLIVAAQFLFESMNESMSWIGFGMILILVYFGRSYLFKAMESDKEESYGDMTEEEYRKEENKKAWQEIKDKKYKFVILAIVSLGIVLFLLFIFDIIA